MSFFSGSSCKAGPVFNVLARSPPSAPRWGVRGGRLRRYLKGARDDREKPVEVRPSHGGADGAAVQAAHAAKRQANDQVRPCCKVSKSSHQAHPACDQGDLSREGQARHQAKESRGAMAPVDPVAWQKQPLEHAKR